MMISLCIAAFHGLTFKETSTYYHPILLLLLTQNPIDWGAVDDEESEKNKENKYFIYFTAKIKSELAL
jgi:hypothetical protein